MERLWRILRSFIKLLIFSYRKRFYYFKNWFIKLNTSIFFYYLNNRERKKSKKVTINKTENQVVTIVPPCPPIQNDRNEELHWLRYELISMRQELQNEKPKTLNVMTAQFDISTSKLKK